MIQYQVNGIIPKASDLVRSCFVLFLSVFLLTFENFQLFSFKKNLILGTRLDSRVEFNRLPNNLQNDFKISVDFNSKSDNGLIFYASDTTHKNFLALFIYDGLVNL